MNGDEEVKRDIGKKVIVGSRSFLVSACSSFNWFSERMRSIFRHRRPAARRWSERISLPKSDNRLPRILAVAMAVRLGHIADYVLLWLHSLKVAFLVGVVPTLIWFVVVSPLLRIGTLDWFWSIVALFLFYFNGFVLMPIIVCIIGDFLGAKRSEARTLEHPVDMDQSLQVYARLIDDKKENP